MGSAGSLLKPNNYDAIVYQKSGYTIAQDSKGNIIASNTLNVNDATVINSAISSLSSGQKLVIMSGNYYTANTTIDITTNNIVIEGESSHSASDDNTSSGVIIYSNQSIDHIMSINTANRVVLRNLYLAGSNAVSDALQIINSRYWILDNISLVRTIRRGLYLYGNTALCANGRSNNLQIYMPDDYGTVSTDIRGIVFYGTNSSSAVTQNTFNNTMIQIKGVTTSRFVDFIQYADNNIFYYLHTIPVSGDTQYGIAVGSNDFTSNVNVQSCSINYLHCEQHNNPAIKCGIMPAGQPFTLINPTPNYAIFAGNSNDLEVIYATKQFRYTDLFTSSGSGYYTPVTGSGSVTFKPDKGAVLTTGTTANSTVALKKYPNTPSGMRDSLGYNINQRLRIWFAIQQTSNINCLLLRGDGTPSTLATTPHYGFKIILNQLYASTSDGTNENTLAINTLTAGTIYELEAYFVPANSLHVWLNGVYSGPLTSNLPSGTTSSFIMSTYCDNNATANNSELDIIKWEYWQEG